MQKIETQPKKPEPRFRCTDTETETAADVEKKLDPKLF